MNIPTRDNRTASPFFIYIFNSYCVFQKRNQSKHTHIRNNLSVIKSANEEIISQDVKQDNLQLIELQLQL